MVVFAIVVQLAPALMEDSHLITEPVCPDSVSVPELVPEQTVAPEATAPPTETALTVMVAAAEFAGAQDPF